MCTVSTRHSAQQYRNAALLLCTALLALAPHFAGAYAVSGISVYHDRVNNREWPPSAPGGDLWLVHIENNEPVKRVLLLDSNGGRDETKARNPVINLTGTQVAFFKCIGKSAAYVTLMDIDGSNERDLAQLPTTDGYNGKGYINWPAGDWIYYSRGGDKSDGSQELWRVNVESGVNESYATFDRQIWQTQMSADAQRMHITKSGTDRYAVSLSPGSISLSESNKVGGGCGAALSPSGLWRLNYNNAGHTDLTFVHWDTDEKQAFNIPDYNAWSVTRKMAIDCKGLDITIGGGHNDAPRFSANSDKWIVTGRGWPGKPNFGRYSSCSRNQVLINWVDRIAVPTTRHFRSCESDDYCSNSEVSDSTHDLESGHFWVKAPIEDINEDLRQYVDGSIPSSLLPGQIRHGSRRMPAAAHRYTIHGRKQGINSRRSRLIILQDGPERAKIMLDMR